MRIWIVLFFLVPFLLIRGQTSPVNKISLGDAITLALANNSESGNEATKKRIVGDVEKTYFQLVYEINRAEILRHQADLMQYLPMVADLRYEAGDIDLLEKNSLVTQFAEVNTSLSRMEDDLAVSRNKLKVLLLVCDELTPADSFPGMYTVKKKERSFPGTDSTEQFIQDRKRENLEYELNGYFKKLQFYNHVGLGQAERLLDISRARFENEDIDYTEYTQQTDEGFRIQLEYLETLNNYNQTAIELEMYAY